MYIPELYGIFPCKLLTKSEDKCCDLIDFAAAELRDFRDSRRGDMLCPMLAALAKVERKKADPGVLFFFWHMFDGSFSVYVKGRWGI